MSATLDLLSLLARQIFVGILMVLSTQAWSAFSQCPSIGFSTGCSLLITIGPNGALSFEFDPTQLPYDGEDDTLVGVVNKSGATVFGISLTGPRIFAFDGDGAGTYAGLGGWSGYEGPGVSFIVGGDANSGVADFSRGLDDGKSLWFSLEGAPSRSLLTTTVTLDPGHGTVRCPSGRTGTTGPTNYPATNPPPGRLLEYKLAFDVAAQLQAILSASGYTVTMTKTSETECPDYKERYEIANNARSNLFVSIHFDGVDNPSVNGSAGLYLPSKTASKILAEMIGVQVSAQLSTRNNGAKARSDLAVLKGTRMSAVLVETATLTNAGGDEDIVHASGAIAKAARGIANGLDLFIGR